MTVLSWLSIMFQVVTESSPVYKTEPVVQTSVIKLFLGAKEIFTTLSQTVGLTTRTDYVYSTRTVGGGLVGLAGVLGGLGQLGGQQVTAEPAVGLAGLVPSSRAAPCAAPPVTHTDRNTTTT